MSEEEKSLRDILEKLSNNMMFRLSLCSKELFHSNFLAYLLETYDKQVVKIFDKSLQDKVKNVKREWKHTDISFECGNELIVIENKLKSMPNQQQLQDYIDKIRQEEDAEEKEKNKNNKKKKIAENNNNENKPKLSRIILLSYYKPHFNLNSHNKVSIKYLSYEDLYEKLKEIKEKKEQNQYFNDYCDMLKLLLDLKTVLNIKKRKVTYGDMINDINDVQSISQQFNFHETLQKIFLSELTSSLLTEQKIIEYKITPFVNYTSSFGTYADLSIRDKNDNYYIISFLLKKDKKHIFHREVGVSGLNRDNAEPQYIANFMFKDENIIFLSNTKNKRTGFWGFEGDSISWLYKKVDVENSKKYQILKMDYNAIKDLVISEFQYIKDNIEL